MVIRIIFTIAVCTFLGIAAYGESQIVLPKDGYYILPEYLAPEVLKQCSRGVPTGFRSFWAPLPEQVETLEKTLPAYVASTGVNIPADKSYHRQYIGYKKDGERYIYGNFYPASDQQKADDERNNAMVVCDGGPQFWGVVYHVDTRSFEDISTNGFAR